MLNAARVVRMLSFVDKWDAYEPNLADKLVF